jgi:alpha-tubulin suppressor-like RCC1 family protein
MDVKESLVPYQIGLNSDFENEKIIEGVCGNNHAFVLSESGNIYGWGQGISGNNQPKGSKQHHKSKSILEIKSFDIQKITTFDSLHKFLLKRKTPKPKPKQYYSRRASPEKTVETSTISNSKICHEISNLSSNNSLKPSLLRNNLPNTKVPFKK